MPYTVSQVVNSDPAAAQRVGAQIDKARTQFAHLAEDWTGTAAAAQKQARESLDEQTSYRNHLYAPRRRLGRAERLMSAEWPR
jgi:hypothetical protein